ncbi:hypothetical protein BACT_0385 [Bifidobacterium actinocoloniiforme DSM 22766]|uniref:Hydrogenase n=1 Tax=Bifidobacterium actinocoloniiforme DSM 22766 TaxID=1437605 RepID=A0A086YZI5_9BIFI|nr:DUF3737 family protein [Bifidobacterium actinocoloniiforme]AKV55010.1 hydrogenase [Bifidobacterium actinocoloniiforme DSM 22766]KFI39685.1 hypothetical protein BACT_0385 [Bifidobacterium actinocoloniiforme DSM 22766]
MEARNQHETGDPSHQRPSTRQERLTGERAAFRAHDHDFVDTTFADGESPLKHASDINLTGALFQWKYPLWYSEHVRMQDCTLFEMARSGIWYTHDITIRDSTIEAPKTFRRSSGIRLRHVSMPNADETLWTCSDIDLEGVTAQGDYFGKDSNGIHASDFNLSGNYAFDGGCDITIEHSRLLSKDAFWNTHDVTVKDSYIYGEYLGWNSRNLTFENCTIESLQGLCYIENLTLRRCKLLNTTLAFEYSTVHAQVDGRIDSILNPSGGVISADSVGQLTLDPACIDPARTRVECAGQEQTSAR